MSNPQPKKNFQIRRMFALAGANAKAACMETADYLRDCASHVTDRKKSSLADLTFDEANDVIKLLGGTPFQLFTRSKRTENYRKQQLGIKTIETDAQLKLIDELAALRGWSHETLQKFCRRVIKKDSPVTTEDGNKIVEGLKAMNRRDGLLRTADTPVRTGGNAAGRQPKFRRVA